MALAGKWEESDKCLPQHSPIRMLTISGRTEVMSLWMAKEGLYQGHDATFFLDGRDVCPGGEKSGLLKTNERLR